jgi:hypothetical protein
LSRGNHPSLPIRWRRRFFNTEVNTNNDQTISLKELHVFAMKKFNELNKAGDKTLSMDELSGRISKADFDEANTGAKKSPTHPTLSRTEFSGYVQKLFREANTKGTRSLSAVELDTPAGKKLIMLLH